MAEQGWRKTGNCRSTHRILPLPEIVGSSAGRAADNSQGTSDAFSPIRSALFVAVLHLAYSPPKVQAADDLQSGIPATDREWFADDYVRAAEAISTGKVSLPKLSDKRGAAVLRRLTSTDNFAFFQSKSIPVDSRMGQFFKLPQAVNSVLKQYLIAANKGEAVHEETTLVLVFTLQISAMSVGLVDEFLPTVPKDDKYAVRMEGLKKMKSGMTTQFVGAERSLSERHFYSSDDLSLLLDGMRSTLPKMKRAFPAEYPAELRERLVSHKATFTREKDRKNIDRMLAELGDEARRE